MKIAIVLKEDLGIGFAANAAACIASGLFHRENELHGEKIEGNDLSFIPITKIPLMIFRQNSKPWEELLKRAKRNKLKYMLFTKEAQSTTDYVEYINRVNNKRLEDVVPLGIGVLGEDSLVNKFSGDLPLLK
ncbi:DUF2000 family protein [Candidatus Woesearchaeota archaeon]|nr:DUF2000 family protein [Candidatus Woesearchaeota archaeon]